MMVFDVNVFPTPAPPVTKVDCPSNTALTRAQVWSRSSLIGVSPAVASAMARTTASRVARETPSSAERIAMLE